jgi:hypothetical protein
MNNIEEIAKLIEKIKQEHSDDIPETLIRDGYNGASITPLSHITSTINYRLEIESMTKEKDYITARYVNFTKFLTGSLAGYTLLRKRAKFKHENPELAALSREELIERAHTLVGIAVLQDKVDGKEQSSAEALLEYERIRNADDEALKIIKEDMSLHFSDEELIANEKLKKALIDKYYQNTSEDKKEIQDAIMRELVEISFSSVGIGREGCARVGKKECNAFHKYMLGLTRNGMYGLSAPNIQELQKLEERLVTVRKTRKRNENLYFGITKFKSSGIELIKKHLERLNLRRNKKPSEDDFQVLREQLETSKERTKVERSQKTMYAASIMERRQHPALRAAETAIDTYCEAGRQLTKAKVAYQSRFKANLGQNKSQ